MSRIRLLAGPSIEGPDGPVPSAVLQRHRLALLALLAMAPNGTLSRDKLIASLWPESETDRARHLLRSAVHVLRRSLGEDAVLSLGDDLRLNPEIVTCDVSEFLERLAHDDLEQAVNLYAGPFLDGFHLNDAPDLERWLDGERSRLQQLYCGALEQLAERAERRGDLAQAAAWWRRVAGVDPYSARVALGLMRSLDAAGDRAAAISHARLYEQLLKEVLGAEADPDVAALAERLRTAPVARTKNEVGASAVDRGDSIAKEPAGDSIAQSAVDSFSQTHADVSRVGADEPRFSAKPRRLAAAAGVIVVVAAFAVASYLFIVPRVTARRVTPAAPEASRTIAVLPFTNLGGDPSEEYFSDGLTEELIAALARVRHLRVAARTSVFAFKDQNRDIREIGRQLNVATILEGSVRRDGARLRIHAQLINATDGFHIWAATYDRNMAGIFELQTELALHIAEALQANLTAGDRQRLAKQPTENLQAHSAYLKGRYYWKQRSGAGLSKAIEYFEEAIAADSAYAPAYAGLASAYGPMGVHGYLSPAEAGARMRSNTLRALAIDPDLAEGHVALAAYRSLYEWDFAGGENEYLRAIELDPSESVTHFWYGYMLQSLGRDEDALAQRKIAADLDPMAASAVEGVGMSYLFSGRPVPAIEQLSKSVELDSTYWPAHLYLGMAYEAMGDFPKALDAFERASAHAGDSPKPKAGIVSALWQLGRKDEARHILESLRTQATRTDVHPPVVATSLVAMGQTNAAFDWLEQAFREKHPDLPVALADPGFASVRTNPRFLDLRRRVGLDR
jgi:TolB-like protein/DNA-binding SARP family transcriptional activator/Flp pilus assembly protein TadD